MRPRMAEHYLNCRDFEVRALLDGRKIQTRRVLKPQPEPLGRFIGFTGSISAAMIDTTYAPGDRLWVREAWTASMTHGWTIADARSRMYGEKIMYRADGDESIDGWWASAQMPREFSRLTLTVTDLRVQRVQEISEADAWAEGGHGEAAYGEGYCNAFWVNHGQAHGESFDTARASFRDLWNRIHGPDAWAANPLVVALTFDVIRANIDRMEAAQ